MPLEGEGFNNQGGNIQIGRGSSVIATPLGDVPGGSELSELLIDR